MSVIQAVSCSQVSQQESCMHLSSANTCYMPRHLMLNWHWPIQDPQIPGPKSQEHLSVLWSYQRLVQARRNCKCFVARPGFTTSICENLAQTPSCRTTACRLSETVYSKCSQLPSILEAFLHPRALHAVLSGNNLSWGGGVIFIVKFFAVTLHCLCNFVFVYDVCPKAEGIRLHNTEEIYTLLWVMGQRMDTNLCITRSLLMCWFTMVTESIAVLRSWTICRAVWCQSRLSIV